MRTLEDIDREVFGAGKEEGEQGSIDWLMARVGHVTASRFKDVLDRLKNGKPGAKRQAYLWEVAIERLTGKPAQHYENAAMMHGTEYEPLARMAYEAATSTMVMEVGFRRHKFVQFVGGSPDGLIGDDGGWEAKCPFNSAHHLACWLDGMPAEHMPQVQGLMLIEDRKWWDFTSYDPRLPEPYQLYIQRIERDENYIKNLMLELDLFLAEVSELLSRIQSAAHGAEEAVIPFSADRSHVAAVQEQQ